MDSQLEQKRLYVSGLFDGIKDEDLIEKFAKFGQVNTVELKAKKNDDGPNANYAFIEMMITPKNLAKCFNVYSNTRWKNCSMKLEVAKESFLSRLQKEREQAANKPQNVKSMPNGGTEIKATQKHVTVDEKKENGNLTTKRKRAADSPPSNPVKKSRHKVPMFGGTTAYLQSNRDEPTPAAVPDTKTAKKSKLTNGRAVIAEPLEQPVLGRSIKLDNTRKFAENGLRSSKRPDRENDQHSANQKPSGGLMSRLEKFSGTWNDFEVVGSEPRKPPSASNMSEKRKMSDKKRLDTILNKKSECSAKQKLIKDALKNLDSDVKINKKITFDDGYAEKTDFGFEEQAKRRKRSDSNGEQVMALFDSDLESDSSEDSQDMFRVKPQYEGEAGQKIIALQSGYGNDKRFKIDKKFIDAEDEEEHVEESSSQREKQRQLEVLAGVLGHELSHKPKDKLAKDWIKIKQMRYDPTQKNAAELEIQEEEKSDLKATKSKGKAADEETVPEVSKERYYNVSTSLKDKFKSEKSSENEPFSLLQSLGAAPNEVTRDDRDGSDSAACGKAISLPRGAWDRNPFKYDSSSDDEDEKPVTANNENISTRDGAVKSNLPTKTSTRKTFFVFDGDSRLQDGINFFVRPDNLDEVRKTWPGTRSRLMECFREKQKKAKQEKAGKTKVASAAKLQYNKMKSGFKTKKGVFKRKRQ